MNDIGSGASAARGGKEKNIVLITVQADLSVIGIKYLHYCLLREGYNSYFLHMPDFDTGNPRVSEKLRQFVSWVAPIFIGISLMSLEYERARDISVFLRKNFAPTPIIWGGIHPTIDPESCFPHADYVCIGEGIRTIVDFANAVSGGRDPRQTPNLCYQEDGQIKRNPLHPLIENLDQLPICEHIPKNGFAQENSGDISPIDRRVLKKHGRYQERFYDIATTLGCQMNCTFCCSPFLSNLYHSHRVRRRGLENIIQELESAVHKYPYIELINFQDENFLSHSLDFFKSFRDEYRKRVNRSFMFACTPIFVTREKIASLKEAGLVWIRMGLESGSDRTLREVYKRKSSSRHFLNAMEIFNEFKIACYCDVIVDNPFETAGDNLETIKTLIETVRPYYLQMFSLTTYNGTELYDRTLKECPEKFRDPKIKNYLEYQQTAQNHLIRIAPYLPRKLMYKLVRMYEQNPGNELFKIFLSAALALCVLFFEPATFFRVFKMSQGGSYIKMIKMLPVYKNILLERYAKHFKRPSWTGWA